MLNSYNLCSGIAFSLAILIGIFDSRAEGLDFKPFSKNIGTKSAGASVSQPLSCDHDKWAVLIGVGSFKDSSIPSIKYGSESAVKLGLTLLDRSIGRFQYDHLVLLKQAEASKATVEDVLNNGVSSKALPSDLIVIYICSRWLPSENGKDIILCSQDTQASKPDSTGLDLGKILATIRRRTQCKNIYCLLDLSPVSEDLKVSKLYSGVRLAKSSQSKSAQSKFSQSSVIDRLSKIANVSILSANDLEKSSAQTPFTQTSYFVRFLIEDLKGSSGYLTVAKLNDLVPEQVRTTVLAEQKMAQLPVVCVVGDSLLNLALGSVFAKSRANSPMAGLSGGAFGKVRFGFDPSRMPIEHPELLPGSGIGTVSRSYGPTDQNKQSAPKLIAAKEKAQGNQSGINEEANALKNDGHDLSQTEDEEAEPANDLNLSPYIAKVKEAIKEKWQPPKGLENRKVVTLFTINKDGAILEAQINQSSGIDAVDQAALAALKAVSPLPALPSGSPKFIQMRYVFQWTVRGTQP